MAWELALVWSETADVLKQESCWAVINQTKTVANCGRMARRRKAYETAMKVFLGFVASCLQKLPRSHLIKKTELRSCAESPDSHEKSFFFFF